MGRRTQFPGGGQSQSHAKGDLAFFYHSGDDRAILGIVEIVREFYPDPTDETKRFGMVDVKLMGALARPVTLDAIKTEPRLNHLALVRQSRLSVMPIDEPSWTLIYAMGGGEKRGKRAQACRFTRRPRLDLAHGARP